MKKTTLLTAIAALFLSTAAARGQQVQHFHWVCSQGDHQGAEMAFARIDNVFRGEYIDPGSQDFCSLPIIGTIDGEGNMNGVCAIILDDGNIYAMLSGQITGNKMQITWMPLSAEHSEFREMEMELRNIPHELKAEIEKHPDAFYNMLYPKRTIAVTHDQDFDRAIPFISKDIFRLGRSQEYGYRAGEWEKRNIRITKGTNEGEVDFHLQIELQGQYELVADMQGTAGLNGNRFRYTEKGYEFEVTVYDYFVVITTISGFIDLSGTEIDEEDDEPVAFKADGVYPFPMGWVFYIDIE
ncbi:MAG: hypothetical protein LBE79_02320 [Tannerella sp.]|jgi:hypothetical protein|nr:hypothetical protein [Tannerella sp.]